MLPCVNIIELVDDCIVLWCIHYYTYIKLFPFKFTGWFRVSQNALGAGYFLCKRKEILLPYSHDSE